MKRIRSATGLSDPDQTEATPEQIAAMQAKAKAEAMQNAMMEAELATKVATAKKAVAQASLYSAQVQKLFADIKLTLANAVDMGADAQGKAIDTAIKMLAAPPAIAIADHLLTEAGFESALDQKSHAASLLSALDQSGAAQSAPALPPPMQPQPQSSPEMQTPMPPPGASVTPGLGAGPA